MMPFEENDIKTIKDSFDALRSKKAPEFVWDKLDKQLYIDWTWLKLKNKLDVIHAYRKRKPAYLAITLILILTIVGTLFFVKNDFDKSENIILLSPELNKQQLTSSQHNSVTSKFNETPISNVVNIKPENKLNYNKSGKVISCEAEYQKITENNQTDLEKIFLANMAVAVYENQFKELRLLPLKTALCPLICNDDNKISYSQTTRDSIYRIDKKRGTSNEIGFIYSLNNPLIVNNHTRLSYQETSLVESVPTLSSNYGLIFNHHLNGNKILSVEYLFTNRENQVVNIFKDGKQYEKNMQLDYTRLTVLYQKNLYPQKNRFFTNYFIKGGCYIAYLKNIIQYYKNNNETINNIPNNYCSYDYGLKLSFGVEKSFESLIMGLGFATEYGLKNIFIGDKITPASFDRTNNFNNGLNFSIRYKFY